MKRKLTRPLLVAIERALNYWLRCADSLGDDFEDMPNREDVQNVTDGTWEKTGKPRRKAGFNAANARMCQHMERAQKAIQERIES